MVVVEQLGTGHEEHTPSHPPLLGKITAIGFFECWPKLLFEFIHFCQPGIGGFFIMGTAPAPMLLQFQVILKPDPGNPQELYLESLQALGINPLEHDIRFVEDDWESPTLGAWGLGWEVWLDGMEIT